MLNRAEQRRSLPAPPRDRLGRPLTDLRLSVIDRCNFRCAYCMPETSLADRNPFLPPEERLDDDELVRLVTAFTRLGVHKVRPVSFASATPCRPTLRRTRSPSMKGEEA